MPLCVKCNREVCNPCVRPPPGRENWRKITVAADHELMNKAYFSRLAMATAALKEELGLSRRSIADWMADVIYGYEGKIVWPGGKLFSVSDTAIDDVFNGDGSFRWLSEFIRYGEVPPRIMPQVRLLDRLRLIDLAFRIARPDVARRF